MSNSKNRYLLHIAYAQTIGIMLVVLGHSFHLMNENHGMDSLPYRMIYSFHMPLFVFVSGFLMRFTAFPADREPQAPHRFAWHKALRLLLPLLFITLLLYVPRALMSSFADDPVELSPQGMLNAIFFSDALPIPYYWFLQMCFLLMVIVYPVLWYARSRQWPPVVTYLVLWTIFLIAKLVIPHTTFFALFQVPRYIGYFILGVLYCDVKQRADKILGIGSPYSPLAYAVAWLAFFFLGVYIEGFLGDLFVVLAALSGILMVLSFSMLMERRGWHGIDFLLGSSYLIFLLSWFPNVGFQQLLSHFVTLPWYVHSILSFAGGVILPWLLYSWLKASSDKSWARTLLFLLGHKTAKPPRSSLQELKTEP